MTGISRLATREASALVADVTHWSLQFWGEHCTECAAPSCHHSCDLFQRGPSGRCRRFADGIVVTKESVGPLPFTFEVLFKPWGRLMAVGNILCQGSKEFARQAPRLPMLGQLSQRAQGLIRFLPADWQWKVTDKVRGLGNRWPRFLNQMAKRANAPKPTEWRGVVGNPYSHAIDLEVSFSGFADSQNGRVYRETVSLAPGWNRIRVPIETISSIIDVTKLFRTSLVPLVEEPHLLQFVYAGFIHTTAPHKDGRIPASQVKLVVVDLDNTLWDGIVLENPERDFHLRAGVREMLSALDERGILLSIASRNHVEDAKRVLNRLGIWDLFIYPQINWEPKSANIHHIVSQLNIGMDSACLIDDSQFEREEVKAAYPEIRVYDAVHFSQLLDRPEFDVPVSEESRKRRLMYRAEERRNQILKTSQIDYDAFLRECQLELHLQIICDENRERVYELVQRTNQLNFSGSRYTRDDLSALLKDETVVPIVMNCHDRMGTYGIVGFAICRVARDELIVSDMMYSCRIQTKKVEHAFLAWLVGSAKAAGLASCRCHFNRTRKNNPASGVFSDMGFNCVFTEGDHEEFTISVLGDSPNRFPANVVDDFGIVGRIYSLANLVGHCSELPES
jgi:FkbH-like protein